MMNGAISTVEGRLHNMENTMKKAVSDTTSEQNEVVMMLGALNTRIDGIDAYEKSMCDASSAMDARLSSACAALRDEMRDVCLRLTQGNTERMTIQSQMTTQTEAIRAMSSQLGVTALSLSRAVGESLRVSRGEVSETLEEIRKVEEKEREASLSKMKIEIKEVQAGMAALVSSLSSSRKEQEEEEEDKDKYVGESVFTEGLDALRALLKSEIESRLVSEKEASSAMDAQIYALNETLSSSISELFSDMESAQSDIASSLLNSEERLSSRLSTAENERKAFESKMNQNSINDFKIKIDGQDVAISDLKVEMKEVRAKVTDSFTEVFGDMEVHVSTCTCLYCKTPGGIVLNCSHF